MIKLNVKHSDKFKNKTEVALLVTTGVNNSLLSQRELADRLGVNPNLIVMWKQGLTKVTIERAEAVAKALNLPVVHFMRVVMKECHPTMLSALESIFVIKEK